MMKIGNLHLIHFFFKKHRVQYLNCSSKKTALLKEKEDKKVIFNFLFFLNCIFSWNCLRSSYCFINFKGNFSSSPPQKKWTLSEICKWKPHKTYQEVFFLLWFWKNQTNLRDTLLEMYSLLFWNFTNTIGTLMSQRFG